MSEKLIPADMAQDMLDRHITLWSGSGGIDWRNDLTLERIATPDDALRTIIAQAEQIKRLQGAFETALSEINDLNEETYNHMAGPFRPQGPADYGITAEDMEDTDDR